MSVDKKEKKAIRMKILYLLDKDPDNPEIQQLSNLLASPEKVKQEGNKQRLKSLKETNRKKNGEPLLFDVKIYIDMRNQGISRAIIADHFGVDLDQLQKELLRARKRGELKPGDIKTRNSRDIIFTKEMYLECKEQGMQEQEIMKKFGIHANSFIARKREWGIRIQEKKKHIAKDILVGWLLKGYTVPQIAIQMNVHKRTVYNTLQYHKIFKKELDHYRIKSKKRKVK
jgi:transposase